MKLSELIYKNEAIKYNATGDEIIERVTADARDCDEGTLLLVTESTKRFIKDINPRGILLCEGDFSPKDDTSFVSVKNPRAAVSYACARLYGYKNREMLMIGVTGTNGKTSTASLIRHALEADGYKVGFIGTGMIDSAGERISDKYYSMTTPDPWVLFPALKKFREDGCRAVVMEVSSHALALEKVAPIDFDYGVFTNLSPEHMDFHKNMDAYLSAKEKLLKRSDTAVINLDDYYGRLLYDRRESRKISVGVLYRGDVYATHVEDHGFDGIEYMYRTEGYNFTMRLNLAGIHNVYNSMLATAVATDIGVRPCVVREALGELDSVCGRFEIIKGDITVIIDYAHTDRAMDTLLSQIKRSEPCRVLHTVFGCGGERDRSKRPRMAAVAEKYSDTVTVTCDNSRREPTENIIGDVIRGFSQISPRVIPDRAEAIRRAVLEASAGDTVVLVGKGAERYMICGEEYSDFDEREIVRAALEERRK